MSDSAALDAARSIPIEDELWRRPARTVIGHDILLSGQEVLDIVHRQKPAR